MLSYRIRIRCHLFFIVLPFVILLTVLPASTVVADVVFHVAPDGNDAWSGRLARPNAELNDGPFGSLQAAQTAIRAYQQMPHERAEPVVVLIADGTYQLNSTLHFAPEDSGTADAPVTYRAAPGAHPVFNAGRQIAGFTVEANGTWKTNLPQVAQGNWYFEQLYVNGERGIRARTPNGGAEYFKMGAIQQIIHENGTGRVPISATQQFVAEPASLNSIRSLSEAEFADLQLVAFHKWDITRRFLDAIDLEHKRIITSGQGMKPWNSWREGTRYRLENYPAALDAPGEWFLARNGDLRYFPRLDEDPETAVIVAPLLDQFIVIEGQPEASQFVEHLRFESLAFRYAKYDSPPEGFEPAQAAAPIDAVVQIDGARQIAITDCEFTHTGRYGIWFRRGCTDSSVTRTIVRDLGAGGIRIGETTPPASEAERTARIIVDNNIIQQGGRIFACAVGVWIGHSSDNQITHNEISDFFYTGVSVGWRWGYDESVAKRNKIEFNRIHKIGQAVLSDMAAVYTLGPSQGTTVSNNIIYDVDSFGYGGWGLYTDEGSTGIRMENNLVYDVKTGGFHQHYGRDNLIRNNILAFSRQYQVQATRVENHRSFTFENNIVFWDQGTLLAGPWDRIDIAMDNNCYWYLPDNHSFEVIKKSWMDWQALGRDEHSIVADPGFVDPGKRNFNFPVDAGFTSPAFSIGFKPFDLSKAGVYGDAVWMEQADF